MPDNMRWRHGDTNPIIAPVDAETEICIGDLLYLSASGARPASKLAAIVAIGCQAAWD